MIFFLLFVLKLIRKQKIFVVLCTEKIYVCTITQASTAKNILNYIRFPTQPAHPDLPKMKPHIIWMQPAHDYEYINNSNVRTLTIVKYFNTIMSLAIYVSTYDIGFLLSNLNIIYFSTFINFL